MQIKKTTLSETEVTLSIVASSDELSLIKNHTLAHFQTKLKLQGFRQGKAPLSLVEKSVDPTQLQSEFLEEAINQLYPQVIRNENLRPVDRPEIGIKKFVPFTTLEFEAKVIVIGDISVSDYKKIKKAKPVVTVTADDVAGVLKSLQTRQAEKKDIDRASKSGDQVWIDFKGTDAKGEAINGADGKDYPLLLGSDTFIPGFETNVIGMSAGDNKTFTLAFPKDYGVKALASKKVTFAVDVTKVQEVIEPKLDDAFAARSGTFTTLKDLKEDIKKQLTYEKQQQADREYESELVQQITLKSKVTVPQVLITDQVERMMQELKQNLVYRGQTIEEFLKSEGKTEDQYRKDVLAVQAEERVKASLVLAEISQLEKLEVSPEELEIRMQLLRAQYKEPQMQAELEKPETRNDIASRLLTEKVVKKLTDYASKK